MVRGRPALPCIHPDEAILSVSPDGRSALVGVLGSYSADMMRVDLATGRRELFKKIGPSDPVRVVLVDAAFTPDGKSYAYSCFNSLQLSIRLPSETGDLTRLIVGQAAQ
jgi:hypothetical protein